MTNETEIDVTGGVDTHKHNHVAAALDRLGGVLATATFPATAAGYRSLLEWLGAYGRIGPWVSRTGSTIAGPRHGRPLARVSWAGPGS